MAKGLTRRRLVKFAGIVGASAAATAVSPQSSTPSNSSASPSSSERVESVSLAPSAAKAAPPLSTVRAYEFFTSKEALFVEAAVDQLIPLDQTGPGALELGVAYFIDQQLMGMYGQGAKMYLEGPFMEGALTQGYQLPLRPREIYRIGIEETNDYIQANFNGRIFSELDRSQQNDVLKGLELGDIELESLSSSMFFGQLLQNTVEGYFADPIYGGNREMGSWKMLGFPGARAEFRSDVGKREQVVYPPVSVAQMVNLPSA